MVTFPEEINPKNGLRLRFKYEMRAYQYLDFFKITAHYPISKFFPLDLTFDSSDELYKFLNCRGIIYNEIYVTDEYWKEWDRITIVDTLKIFEVDESIEKYRLNYRFYSVNEASEMLSLSRPTIYKLVNEQTLRAIRIHGQLRINHLDLIAFINKENQQ